ncbi:D-alanyl-D-alanine carboxypeptidase [Nocardia tenerifensis]|uniref:D-alanyl-D-alanine carboxypeptidase n=1 Tax=Nocardia tenerifensis TaxID=228006 RepID=A0A318K1N3_9NOCA|nr:serine hydrolase domain-containing protein [Nocardia tenerifensis]PXX62208.1 D-alanyl-D-alanine carboxypeptidase [Nocardia tenerifensis]
MLGHNASARLIRVVTKALTAAVVATALVACGADDECGRDVGCAFPADAGAAIDETVRKNMDAGLIPGALVTVHDPARGNFTKAYGVADLATGRAMTIEDHIRIGSITKTFTATAILRAADDNKLSLDDALSEYVPGVPNGDAIALRDLLGMRGGVRDLMSDTDFLDQFLAKTPGEWRPGDSLRTITGHPERAQPPHRETEYSNSEYLLLGLVLEKVTGKPVHEVLDEVATAYGLPDTTYPADATMPAPASRGYAYFDDAATDVTARNTPELFGAAGSMVSTIGDLADYAPRLARGELLKPETHRARLQFTTGTAGGGPLDYGLGMQRFGPWLGHTGGVLGYTTHLGYLPDRGITVAVAVNQYTVPPTLLRVTASSIWFAIVARLYPDSLPGHRDDPVPAAPPPPSPAELSARLQEAFDPKVPVAQKSLRVVDDDKDPELLARLATAFTAYPMSFQVDKLTQFGDGTLLATTTTSFAGGRRPMVVPLAVRDDSWRLSTGWVCENLTLVGQTSPACA